MLVANLRPDKRSRFAVNRVSTPPRGAVPSTPHEHFSTPIPQSGQPKVAEAQLSSPAMICRCTQSPPFIRFLPFRSILSLPLLLISFIPLFFCLTLQPVQGGLSPSDVVVVVNANSLNSRTLANHFVSLRHIPAINVVVLEDIPSSEVITVDDFRAKILKPLIQELDRRQLLDHIQCVTYSADFPTAIDLKSDLKDIKDRHQVFTPVGSINALTYLFVDVLASNPAYIGFHSNFYARREISNYFTNPGGASTTETWNQFEKQMADGDHQEAADSLEKMLVLHPHQHPLAYLAASQAALAGDSERALKLLQQAVAKGWNSSRYLKNDQRFASLRDKAEYQLIELSLDDSIREMQPPLGFEARLAWTPNGLATDKPEFGNHYLLSTVLGVTRGAGTSLPEAITALQRSASADFTHPQGSFYFSLTNDIRTTTRQWGFVSAVDDLRQLGFTAETISTALPQGKKDILGVQLGTPTYRWSTSGSEMLPGALADNLTSMGGMMRSGGGQTTLSELIRAGAAGSSGTVTEPYALQEKFPHAQMYVAYARGASLAEAFYSYVTGPYQLLIVGDPLCQPCSYAPQPQLDTSLRKLAADEPLKLSLTPVGVSYGEWLGSSEPVAKRNQPLRAAAMRILLDGLRPQVVAMQSSLNIALTNISVGYHEIVMQFVAEGPLSHRSNTVVPLWIGPEDSIVLELLGTEPASQEQSANAKPMHFAAPKPTQQISLQAGNISVKISAKPNGTGEQPQKVSLWHDSEQLESTEGATGEFTVRLDRLGMGPVRLQAQTEFGDGKTVKSQPVWLQVVP